MAKKDRTLSPELRETAVALRVAGMSERAIYEGFRDVMKAPPSYRDLRAAFKSEGILSRADATYVRKAGVFPRASGAEKQIHRSGYIAAQKEMRTVDFTANRDEAFNRKYVLGYMGRYGVEPEDLELDAGDDLFSIYDDEGS